MKNIEVILIPEKIDYPEFWMSYHKLINQLSTAKEINGTPYTGNITWEQALRLNLNNGKFFGFKQCTPSCADMRYALFCLYEKHVYDIDGNKLNSVLQKRLFDEITKQRNPFGGEWLGDKFIKKEDGFYLLSHYELDSEGNLIPKITEKIHPNTLMEDGNINLIDWLKFNYTPQGLPTKKVERGNTDYGSPISGSVAGFYAYSFGAGLGCDRSAGDSDSSLGVRTKFLEKPSF